MDLVCYKSISWVFILIEKEKCMNKETNTVKYSLTIKPALPVSDRHKIMDFLESLGYSVWASSYI